MSRKDRWLFLLAGILGGMLPVMLGFFAVQDFVQFANGDGWWNAVFGIFFGGWCLWGVAQFVGFCWMVRDDLT